MQNPKEHIRHFLLFEYQLGHFASEEARNMCCTICNNGMSTTMVYVSVLSDFENKAIRCKMVQVQVD